MALPSGERRAATRPERLSDAVEIVSDHNCPDVSLTQQAATGGFINLMSYCDHRHPGLSATRPSLAARLEPERTGAAAGPHVGASGAGAVGDSGLPGCVPGVLRSQQRTSAAPDPVGCRLEAQSR